MAYGMEVTTEKRKIMTNNMNNISADISMNSQKLEEVWFVYVTRHDSLSKTILQGILEGGWRCGRHRKCWMDNIKEWTSLPMPELLTGASCRKDWKRVCAESSLMLPHPPPPTLPPTAQSVKGLNWIVLVFSLRGRITQPQSTNWNEMQVASERVWASYSPSQWTGFIQHFAS